MSDNTTTPADELRAAATRLRDTAAKAPKGPWQFVPDLYWDRSAIMSDSPDLLGWDRLVLTVQYDSEHPAAEWAVLASPALAEPLADLLDAIAATYERGACDSHPPCNHCMEPSSEFIDALRVVVAINPGGES